MSDVTPSVRAAIAVLVVLACGLTTVGVVRVTRQHEVLRLGYELSRQAQQVRELQEMKSRLALERATLTAPDRIRRLAIALGMTTVAPDRIRIVEAPPDVGLRASDFGPKPSSRLAVARSPKPEVQ